MSRLVKIDPVVLEKVLKVSFYIHYLAIISPLRRTLPFKHPYLKNALCKVWLTVVLEQMQL